MTTKCVWCGKQMDNICICGAYRVTEENHDKKCIEIYGVSNNGRRNKNGS